MGGEGRQGPSTRRRLGALALSDRGARRRSARRDATNRCFRPEPWIAPPPGLVNAPPTQPGEVRFASKLLRRRSGLVLVVALTREEAEERHRTRQDYVLAMRRPDESLLVVRHLTGWSPHDPEQPRNPASVPAGAIT